MSDDGGGPAQPGRQAEPGVEVGRANEDHREVSRVPVRLAVSARGRSAQLGRTRDLNHKGLFIETPEPFEVGQVVPLIIELGPKESVEVRAEVVRKTPIGMGLRFAGLSGKAERALKRWLSSHVSTEGDKKHIAELVAASSKIRPISDPGRILTLLGAIRASGSKVTLVPADLVARDHGQLVEIDRRGLTFDCKGATHVGPGRELHALLTLDFVSYSFSVTVERCDGARVLTSLPTTIVFSERRLKDRDPAPIGSVIRWPTAIEGLSEEVEYPLHDLSDYGLSFTAPRGFMLPPGTVLEGAYLLVAGSRVELERPTIKNLRLANNGSELRVGMSTSIVSPARARQRGGRVHVSTPLALFRKVRDAVSVLFNRGKERLGATAPEASRVIIRRGDLDIVGLIDRTSSHLGRLEAPLVIVVPGFAGRKEQMSYLAGILVEGFARNGREVAVLRFDGTNNLGESSKDQRCEREGLQTLHYTISGVAEDLAAVVTWAKNNPYVSPTHIVLVSVSLGSVGVRRYLGRPDAADVSLWVNYMGAADVVDAVKNVSGNVDLHSAWKQGGKLGIVSMAGMWCDGDRFWSDLVSHGGADLEAAIAEMREVACDVVWLRGLHDGYMDPRRVETVALAPARGARELVDVAAGHLPRTSDEAISQFLTIAERVFEATVDQSFETFKPSLGRLEVRNEKEWHNVRRPSLDDPRTWWRDYLLGGFDILEWSPTYNAFMDLTAERAVEGLGKSHHVLELGAGTGNVTRRMLQRGARVTALDLVPEALDVLVAKCADHAGALSTRVGDLEGTPLIAMARFLSGDLRDLSQLAERIPGFQRRLLDELVQVPPELLYAIARGLELDVGEVARAAKLSAPSTKLLLDLQALARVVTGRVSSKGVRLEVVPASVFDASRGLDLDGRYDAVVLSLVVSYLSRPEDVLAEAFRALAPGGRLVVSSLRRDAETSRLYLEIIRRLEVLPSGQLPSGDDPEGIRASLIATARRFVDHGAALFRLEEEGLFRFYEPDELARLVALRGFVDIRVESALGSPPQAVVVTCRRP